MSFINRTPFSAELFRQFNLAGALNGVVAVRGTFDFVPNHPLALAQEQAPFQWSDGYEGDPHSSHLVTPSDFAPFKPATDISILGMSYAPDGVAARSWLCGVRIPGRLEKMLRVYGPRYWEPRGIRARRNILGQYSEAQLTGWKLTQPELAFSVPLSWMHAFGGASPLRPDQEPPADVHPYNGIGAGLLDLNYSPKDRLIPAPQIEAPDKPISDWRQDYEPQGFAPIPPWWRFRQQYAGTVDENWAKERHPFLPEDFDFRFWQCAHPDLILDPWLSGDERIEFINMNQEHALLRTQLPNIALIVRVKRSNAPVFEQLLVLDGVHFDFRRFASRVHLTWRTAFPYEEESGEIELLARFSTRLNHNLVAKNTEKQEVEHERADAISSDNALGRGL